MRCFIACSLLLLPALTFGAESALSFQLAGKELKRATAKQISAKVTEAVVTFADPMHGGKKKTYRCWPIELLMLYGYGPGWDKGAHTEAVLTAADGYASQAEAKVLREDGGCLAFEDLDAPKGTWEPIGRKKADPAPFYLVWTKPDQGTDKAYPWPWQLSSIDLIKFEDRYPEVMPKGANPDEAAYKGYQTFRALCMRCHAINQQGGKIGPDLNAPQAVTSYRTQAWLKDYIKQPSKYRYTQMPDHTQLTDADLEGLYRYFLLKAAQPEKTF